MLVRTQLKPQVISFRHTTDRDSVTDADVLSQEQAVRAAGGTANA
jgi:hypothetical protein